MSLSVDGAGDLVSALAPRLGRAALHLHAAEQQERGERAPHEQHHGELPATEGGLLANHVEPGLLLLHLVEDGAGSRHQLLTATHGGRQVGPALPALEAAQLFGQHPKPLPEHLVQTLHATCWSSLSVDRRRTRSKSTGQRMTAPR